MTNIVISDPEWDLLSGEPGDYFKLYAALKRRMDFASGIVGRKTLINETVLRDAITVDPVQGRAKPKPLTRQRYRSAVARLEKLGLLKRIGTLVFFLPQANTDTFAQNNNNQKIGRQQPASSPLDQTAKASAGKALRSLSKGENRVSQPKKSDNNNLLPALKASNYLPTTAAAQPEGEDVGQTCPEAGAEAAAPDNPALAKFSMSLDWQPARASLETLASYLGVSLDDLTADFLADWRVYWAIKHPEREQTQRQWELQLVTRLKHLAIEAAERAQRAEAQAAKDEQAEEANTPKEKPGKARKAASGKVIHLHSAPPPVSGTEKPKQQEQAMPSVQATDEMMPVLYRKLRGMYGHLFERQYPTESEFDWSSVLGDLSHDQILAGLRRLVEQCGTDPYAAYPPPAMRFRQVCLQIPGLPDTRRAWFEALNADYSHDAVQYAAKVTGFAALQSAKSGLLEPHQMRLLRERFEFSFQQAKERLMRGEPLSGSKAVAREPLSEQERRQQQEHFGEIARLNRIIEAGERPGASPYMQSEAQRAREQLQPLQERAKGQIQSIHSSLRQGVMA
ncbi:hypothetical protein AXE65_04160 [Ventosimonas gracilis]|uniref:DnaT DNA-binding domain-containing protein n=1 Tax=Ventosimonas gracilis TaxID=1680762 RepID=A0A139SR20_9GAMM|nr:DnaT-like ssDNA-binding domain-containing protein [Ventosimonas gracilis]KXU36982.1 hypothetical protein AXE65_04160 [Ventosimonas gracilis]